MFTSEIKSSKYNCSSFYAGNWPQNKLFMPITDPASTPPIFIKLVNSEVYICYDKKWPLYSFIVQIFKFFQIFQYLLLDFVLVYFHLLIIFVSIDNFY